MNRKATLIVAFLAASVATLGGEAGGPEHDGSVVDCDLPMPIRIHNTGGTDGAGLCVWASADMMATYLNCRELMDVFEYMQTQKGGGWPERVDRIMRERAPGVKFKQYMGDSLDFAQEFIDSGRPVCITLGTSEFYKMQTIAHMVLLVSLDEKYAGILDNNDEKHIWWMPREEFRKRACHPNGEMWAWGIFSPPPPPVPHGR